MISRLIINADDLGISRIANEATLDLMATGRITSATVLGNGPDLSYLNGRVTRLGARSFGVHLNATQFRPLTHTAGLRVLLSEDNEMIRLGRPFQFGPGLLQALYEEFCAQVESVGRLGIVLSHLDSHHHIHTQAALFPVLKAIQRRYRIHKVRLSKNVYLPEQAPAPSLQIKKRLYNWLLKTVYATTTTDVFTEFSTFHELLSRGMLPSVGSMEAMVHPGAPRYQAETELLGSDWRERLPSSTTLINYGDLR